MRNFPAEAERVESGPIRFGDDWPGLFMRGDDAFGLSLNILTVWQHLKATYEKQNIKMPLDLHLAMLGLAGVFDTIQDGVVVGGRIVKDPPDLSAAISATIQHTDVQPTAEKTSE